VLSWPSLSGDGWGRATGMAGMAGAAGAADTVVTAGSTFTRCGIMTLICWGHIWTNVFFSRHNFRLVDHGLRCVAECYIYVVISIYLHSFVTITHHAPKPVVQSTTSTIHPPPTTYARSHHSHGTRPMRGHDNGALGRRMAT